MRDEHFTNGLHEPMIWASLHNRSRLSLYIDIESGLRGMLKFRPDVHTVIISTDVPLRYGDLVQRLAKL